MKPVLVFLFSVLSLVFAQKTITLKDGLTVTGTVNVRQLCQCESENGDSILEEKPVKGWNSIDLQKLKKQYPSVEWMAAEEVLTYFYLPKRESLSTSKNTDLLTMHTYIPILSDQQARVHNRAQTLYFDHKYRYTRLIPRGAKVLVVHEHQGMSLKFKGTLARNYKLDESLYVKLPKQSKAHLFKVDAEKIQFISL